MSTKKKMKRLKNALFVLEQYDTAAVDSYAATISEVVGEIRLSTISERGARIDDKRSGGSDGEKTTYFEVFKKYL
jgi:hypothetical protein